MIAAIRAALAPYLVWAKLAAIAALVFFAYSLGFDDGFSDLKADWDAQQLRQAADNSARLAEQARESERLKAAYLAKEAIYESRLVDSDRRAAALADSLHKRPGRAAAAVSAAASGNEAATCGTGAGLYREDAAFLVGEARRANELREALSRCQDGDLVQEGGRGDH